MTQGKRDKDGLTPKMRAFAEATLEHATLSEAYRAVYDAEGMRPATIRKEASKLATDPRVAGIIDRLTAERVANQRTEGARLREFVRERLIEEATGADSASSRVRAVELLGKLAGVQAFDPERTEQTVVTSAAEAEVELESALEEALRDPKVAQLFEKTG